MRANRSTVAMTATSRATCSTRTTAAAADSTGFGRTTERRCRSSTPDRRTSALSSRPFFNVPLTEPPSRVLLGRRLIGKCVSQLQVSGATDLKLVQLLDPGLLRLSLRPAQITATNTSHYPRTRRWAEEIHRQIGWAQGLIWMSARMNCDRAVILFGDRVDPSALTVTGPPVDLDDSAGVIYVRDIGAKAGIRVTWPSSIPAP